MFFIYISCYLCDIPLNYQTKEYLSWTLLKFLMVPKLPIYYSNQTCVLVKYEWFLLYNFVWITQVFLVFCSFILIYILFLKKNRRLHKLRSKRRGCRHIFNYVLNNNLLWKWTSIFLLLFYYIILTLILLCISKNIGNKIWYCLFVALLKYVPT